MRSHYQHLYSDPYHRFLIKHPNETVIDAWLNDMTQLAKHYATLPGLLTVLILIEYDGTYAAVSIRYTLNRVLDWMQSTPRAHPARVSVLSTEVVLPNIINPVLNVFRGRDRIRVLHCNEREEALRWLLAESTTQSSK